MASKNRFETFEKFFNKFIFIINFLRLKNNEKIIHLFRNLTKQLTEKNYYLNEVLLYSEYVKKMR